MVDEELSWIRQVNLQIAKGYGKLRHASRFKNFLDEKSKIALIEMYFFRNLIMGT